MLEAQETAPVVRQPAVEVSATPLAGLGVDPDQVPANTQTSSGDELKRGRARTFGDLVNETFNSISISEAQGNPFQPEVTFRGFSASSLLGNPAGISVFFDGVRVNEPFGDTVLWDLIPSSAIESISIVPGSNPLFGLNTLGGAISIRTKSGRTSPGAEANLGAGSFGRRTAGASVGGAGDYADGFMTCSQPRH